MRVTLKSIFRLLTIFSITLASSLAGAPFGQVRTSASGAVTSPPDFDRLRVEGFDAVYSLDYQTARERFENMTRVSPDHPAGYLYLANNLWLETLNRSRRLLTSVYTNSSFYAEVKKEDRVDAQRDRQFTDLMNKALATAKARLQKNPNDAEALYYQASAYGLRAAYGTSVKRSFTRAIGDANDSIRIHKQVLKINPQYTDSYLSIGLYEYVIDSLPFGWRLLARVAGLKGSKKKGIEHLEQVVTSGKYTSDDARVVLIGIYDRENRLERSLELLNSLAARYPRNYLFQIERATMLYRLDRREEGAAAFTALLKDPNASETATDLIHFSWGLGLQDKGDYQGALEHFGQVSRWPKAEAGLVSLAHLNSGKSLDAMGKREEASAEYQTVLKRDNVFDSHKQATEYLKKPFAATKS
jgi:tetratricopeptide (TPR) repeat protein